MTTTTVRETATESELAAAPRIKRRRVMSRISIQSKLLVMLLATSILSAAVVGVIGYQSGRTSLRASVFDRLTEIRASQSRQLEAQFSDLKNSLIVYTRDATMTDAVDAFAAAFDQLNDATISPAQQQSIFDYYNNQFAKAELNQTNDHIDVEALLPTSNPQKYLQAYYTAPFTDWDKAIRFEDAHDGSPWSAANAKYNEYFREIVTRFDFEDALLLDTRGNVVYTAYKGVDLGTNILTGPYRNAALRDAYGKALAANAIDYVGVTDFSDYQPADQPTAWMVSPVGTHGRVAGVLALQFPISKINRIMTLDKHWESAGLGHTGETFLVGPDNLMRSDSRAFLENPEQYKRDVIRAGTPPDVAEAAIRQDGTTLVQPVATEATRAAQRGESGTLVQRDYLGHDTLQAYAPVNLTGLNWSMIAKIDTSEAFAPVSAFTRTLVLSTVVIIFAVCLAAMLLARLFVRPVRRLEAGAQQISAGDYYVTLPVVSRDEFGDLTVAFNAMSRNLAIKDELLTEQRRENDRLLLSLMPKPVMQRYRDGEETIAQDHQDVTVIFADIIGLDDVTAEMTSDEALSIVNTLVREFDAAAEHLSVERVRTLRNGYLASCGLSVPRLDNVRRTVDFAVDMQRIVDRYNGKTGSSLRLRAGIDTGTVTSGLVGRSTLAYDMWGSAVNLAYQIQTGAPRAGIYVTSRVYEAMRDTRQFSAAGEINGDDGREPVWRLVERQP